MDVAQWVEHQVGGGGALCGSKELQSSSHCDVKGMDVAQWVEHQVAGGGHSARVRSFRAHHVKNVTQQAENQLVGVG